MIKKSILFGLLGGLGLLGFYFVVLTLVSGFPFAKEQFSDDWHYVIALSFGFGIQIGLYSYLKMLNQVQHDKSGRVVLASGTTSTVAMIACCSHYLVNVLPIIGITGFITLVSQYQTQLFLLGIISNLIGIFYLMKKALRSA